MVRYRRHRVPGGTFFFTVTLQDRRSRALVEHVRALRLAVRTARVERPFSIDAVVILPDHLHAIFSLPPGDADFSGRWRRIKSLFTRQVRSTERLDRSPKGEYGLWQRRFWEHTIRDEDDLVRHVDYIHWNPVKHGLVSRVRDWPHSSFHRYVRMGWLAEDWGGDVGDPGGGFGEPIGR
jgi:putative transposase